MRIPQHENNRTCELQLTTPAKRASGLGAGICLLLYSYEEESQKQKRV